MSIPAFGRAWPSWLPTVFRLAGRLRTGASSIPTVLAENSTLASWGKRLRIRRLPAGHNLAGQQRPQTRGAGRSGGNRVQDMDDEGSDVHFLIPASWTSAVGLEDVEQLELGLIRAYHRHMADFCGQFPTRLKSMIVASTRAVDEAVREIRRWGTSQWAVAVMPLLGKDTPADHPALEPLWQAAQEYDLAVAHQLHLDAAVLPWLPGSLGQHFLRLASHPWGAMRFMAAFIGAGILDRYPAAHGCPGRRLWLATFWSKRMDEQAGYVGGVAPLKHVPSEYVTSGRFFCSIEMHEGRTCSTPSPTF